MATSCRWTFVGPSCLPLKALSDKQPGRTASSGRISALALHPDDPDRVVYAGAASGGVWKTIDGGLHWRPLTDHTDCLNTGAIVIDPSNHERVFVGTGEGNYGGGGIGAGAGILRSDDGGATWTTIGSELQFARITGMAIDRQGNHLFVSATSGAFRSDDHGDTWTQLDGDDSSGLALDDSDPAALRLYVARHGTGIFTSDGFGAFTQLTTGLPDASATGVHIGRIRLTLVADHPEVLYAAYSDGQTHDRSPGRLMGIFRSPDHGATWSTTGMPATPGDQAEYDLVIAAHPTDPSFVLLGMQRLWRSRDAGAHWKQIGDEDADVPTAEIHADVHALTILRPATPAAAPILWIGTDGGVFRSPDGGEAWAHRNRGLGTMQFYSGAHHPDVDAFLLAGSQDNGAQLFAGHVAWGKAQGGDAGVVAIDPQHESRWYLSAYQKVARSTDYARSFVDMHVGGGPFVAFYPPFVLAPSRPDVLYFGTEQLHRTDGDGERWETIKEFDIEHAGSQQRISAIAVAPADDTRIYVGCDRGRFYRVDFVLDIHANVTRTDPEPWLDRPNDVFIAFISDIAVSPRDKDRVYVVIGTDDAKATPQLAPRVLRSDDGGAHWTDLTPNLPWVSPRPEHSITPAFNPLHAVVIDPDVTDPSLAHERLFVGGDIGVFESRDAGATWIARHDGLPNARVYDLQIHARGRVLRAMTYGRGAWELPLGADPCPPGPPATVEADLFVRDQPYDSARGETLEKSPNPLAPEPADPAKDTDDSDDDRRLRWYEAPDLKIDVEPLSTELADDEPGGFQKPLSSTAYDGAQLDALGFQALAHRRPRRGATARVYLQVHNRGPDAARQVKARVFWAVGDARKHTLPELPPDFWASFPDGDPGAGGWTAIGPAQTLAEVRPGEPSVVRWEWAVPGDAPKVIGVLAVVTSADDPVLEGHTAAEVSRDPEICARTNKRVLLRRTKVNQRVPKTATWKKVLKYAGIGLGIGAGLVGGYYLIKKIDS